MTIPQTGLIGAEQALMGGATQARQDLLGGVTQARQDLLGGTQQGVGALQYGGNLALDQLGQARQGYSPYQQAGSQAADLQAALSGALGPQAQSQAYQGFMSSPGQDFLRERGEQAVLRNAAALGGLGGGNVMKELTAYGTGVAAQDFDNYYNRLAGLSGQGLQASQGAANVLGQGAGITSQLGQSAANLYGAQGSNLANIAGGYGSSLANISMGTGQDLAAGRTRAAEQIAGQVGGTTSALADLLNTQGINVSSLLGGAATNYGNVLSALGSGEAGSLEQLANMLGNVNIGQASTVASQPIPQQQITTPYNYSGGVTNLLGAATGLAEALPNRSSGTTWTPVSPIELPM